MPACGASLCLVAAERPQWPRVYSLGRPRSKQDCPKGNPNPETRTNPGHDCNPGLRFC